MNHEQVHTKDHDITFNPKATNFFIE